MGTPNYITPSGADRLQKELHQLCTVERPKTVDDVATAAAHGDRSENAEYKYGKLRLRDIDRRIRFLTKRLDTAVIVDPSEREATGRGSADGEIAGSAEDASAEPADDASSSRLQPYGGSLAVVQSRRRWSS